MTPHAAWVADATPLRRATNDQLRSAGVHLAGVEKPGRDGGEVGEIEVAGTAGGDDVSEARLPVAPRCPRLVERDERLEVPVGTGRQPLGVDTHPAGQALTAAAVALPAATVRHPCCDVELQLGGGGPGEPVQLDDDLVRQDPGQSGDPRGQGEAGVTHLAVGGSHAAIL